MNPNIPTQQDPLSQPVSQQPLVQQSPIQQNSAPLQPIDTVHSSGGKFKFIVLTICIIIFLSISTTVLFAYDKLPIKNYDLQNKIANVLMSVPLMPKTPRFVLESSANAHLKITRFSFDTSIAADSSNLNSLLGTSSFDAQVTGKVDYADVKKPLVDINAKITKDFNLDFRAKDQIIYFRINTIPALIAVMLNNYGFTESVQKQVFNKWLFVDTKPLNTDARAALDSNKNSESFIQQGFKNYLDAFNNKDVLKSLSMAEEKINDTDVYHIHFVPNDDVLNVFWDKYTKKEQDKAKNSYSSNYKISNSIKSFVIDIWIDKVTYLIQKSSVRFNVKASNNISANIANPLGMLSSQQDIPTAVSVKLSDFDKSVVVDAPKDAVKFDDLIKSLMPQMASQSARNNFQQENSILKKENIGSQSAIFNAEKLGKCEKSGIERNIDGTTNTFKASGELLAMVNNQYWQIELDTLNPKYGLVFDSDTKFIGKPQSSFKIGDCITATIRSGEAKVSTISLQ
jgi:hypothetical protein